MKKENYDDEKEQGYRRDILRALIAKKLDLVSSDQAYYLIDCMQACFIVMDRRIKELEKYKKHRHKTIMGLYTETPVY